MKLKKFVAVLSALCMMMTSVDTGMVNVISLYAEEAEETSEILLDITENTLPEITLHQSEGDNSEEKVNNENPDIPSPSIQNSNIEILSDSTEKESSITGSAGDNITFTLDKGTGLLTLSGSGSMTNASSSYSSMLFYEYREYVKDIIIEDGITSIGNYAFFEFEKLESISISESVQSIGKYAFYRCTALENLTLPLGITEIPEYTFYGSGIKTLELPQGVTTIEKYAFKNCSSLKSISIPEGVTTIGDYAFYECSELERFEMPDSVISVGYAMFKKCTSLADVKLSAQLKELPSYGIMEGFFGNCTSLKTITLPAALTKINYVTFAGCTSLESIVIPDNVTTIATSAFSGCTALKEVSIPESVTKIEDLAFNNCTALEQVTLPKVLLSIGGTSTGSSGGAFQDCSSLTAITIPASVTWIGNSAFKNCTSLADITFEGAEFDIGENAFDNTAYIESQEDSAHIILNDTIYYKYLGLDTVVEIPKGVTSIAGGAFSNVTSLTSVIIPEGVSYLGAAFENQKNLKKVQLPSTLENIEENAFYKCSSLTEIVFPDALKEIGESAFEGCSSLKNITFGNGLVKINSAAFEDCSSLTSVSLPDSLEFLGAYVFNGCTALESVTAGDSLLTVRCDAFEATPYLDNAPDEVILGNVLVKYKGNAERLVIPEGITAIAEEAVYANLTLTDIIFPSTLKKIGWRAFLGTPGIKTVILPKGIEEIEDQSIGYSLSAVTSGYIDAYRITVYGYPSTAAETYCTEGDDAWARTFVDISNLSGTCGESAEWTIDLASNTLIISGTGAIENYGSYSNRAPYYQYRDLIHEIVIEDGITELGDYAFYYLNKAEKIDFGETVTKIGESTFEGCSQIKSLSLPDSLKSISADAFSGLKELNSVVLPKSLKTFDASAFSGTGVNIYDINDENAFYSAKDGILYSKSQTQLIAYPPAKEENSFHMPETVSGIAEKAFYKNQRLETIIFGENLAVIGDNALAKCETLKKIIFLGEAPSVSNYSLNTNQITLCCYFEKQGWESLKSSLKYPEEVSWENLNAYAEADHLEIQTESTNISIGETLQLTPHINPALATDFIWKSNNNAVAAFADGTVMAISPGTAVITATSSDGKYTAEITIESTGEAYRSASHDLNSLDEKAITYSSISEETMQIPYEKLNGIYFLNGHELSFYSMVTKTLDTVTDFGSCTTAYVKDDLLYLVSGNQCRIYNLFTRSIEQKIYLNGYKMQAVGADKQNRIYLAAQSESNSNQHRIFLYSSEGNLLDSVSVASETYCFSGFDETNGNFYVEDEYDWVSWHYSHPTRVLKCGNVTDEKITFSETVIPLSGSNFGGGTVTGTIQSILDNGDKFLLCQEVAYEHRRSSAMLGHYMAAVSVPIGGGSFLMFDSNQYSCGSSTNALVMALERQIPETETNSSYSDPTTVGVRAVWNESRQTALVYTEKNKIAEYDPATGEKYAEYQASNYVFSMDMMGNTLVLFEYDTEGQHYIETFDLTSPVASQVFISNTEMTVGDSEKISLADIPYVVSKCWPSSDNSIVSVTDQGIVTAWKPGIAEIKCAPFGGEVIASITVTVKENNIALPESISTIIQGTNSDNVSDNNYARCASTVKSYLFENSEHGLTRVEYLNNKILIEEFSSEGDLLSSASLEIPLPIFGGFYSGKNANYVVVGQSNNEESDEKEILRILKYSKDWKLLDSASMHGANTTIPFDAGSLRMTEKNGNLYIHTSHEMYTSDDGLNHQANMTYVLNEENMMITDSSYEISTLHTDYVSHSFNQFVAADENAVYRCDHGDGTPRAVRLTRSDFSNNNISEVSEKNIFNIRGYAGDNDTGVSVGGLVLSSDNCLVVGNSVDMLAETYSAGGQRNIFLSVTDKKLNDTSYKFITSYTKENGINPRTPQIMNIAQDMFIIMWEEYNTSDSSVCVKALTVDGDGNITQEAVTLNDARLSDCQPITSSKGLVTWYVTDNNKLYLYELNPYNLSSATMSDEQNPLIGDINNDGEIDLKDVVLIRRFIAGGWDVELDTETADVNNDGEVDLKDVVLIRRYIAGGWDVELA